MIPGLRNLALSSLKFYRRPVLYQIAIIAILSAVITGSLLTGSSVRLSLRKIADERLGNSGYLVSSGLRYFDPVLSARLAEKASLKNSSLLEVTGYCQSMSTQKSINNTHILAIDSSFFSFHGNDSVKIRPGEVAVNKKLAEQLDLKEGEDLIIRFGEITDIPSEAPFAPEKGSGISIVRKVGLILDQSENGNFSLSISQIMPMNIFINRSDLAETGISVSRVNRLIISKNEDLNTSEIHEKLKQNLRPGDIGLHVRYIGQTGGNELVSDRIFIDRLLLNSIDSVFPSSEPLITYLANSVAKGGKTTPYSFVSALPPSLYPDIDTTGIVVNEWLADDLGIGDGDTIRMAWYSPDSLNKLIERNTSFIVKRVVDLQGIWSDPLLMPDFPGISGKESCSQWDAGTSIDFSDIRDKDENYWNQYKGTPKAFISYETGRSLWGNNFGPATSVRFPAGINSNDIENGLSGSIDPALAGFTVTDISGESLSAAEESVDFSSLFLSLGFFMILASFILLSMALSSWFDSKQDQIKLFFALGFKNRIIERIYNSESVLIALIGSSAGAFAGLIVNIIITWALNSVWRGAVQTDSLESFFSPAPVLTGFFVTFLLAVLFMIIKLKRHLRKLGKRADLALTDRPPKPRIVYFIILYFVSLLLFVLSLVSGSNSMALSFGAGTSLFISFIAGIWQYLSFTSNKERQKRSKSDISGLYYSFYPAQALTPVLFIAAGIFSVFITGANRMDFSTEQVKKSGGTGGYQLWGEFSVPVNEDMNSIKGRRLLGLDDDELKEIDFVQMKRLAGNDASCLNLNHITVPPLLGIDPAKFISDGSFSFSKYIKDSDVENPWELLDKEPGTNIIYGIADQTVIQWGLMVAIGDTLVIRAENGQPLKIVIAGGLKSSVFQGHLLIGIENFVRYFPSGSGTQVFLAGGDLTKTGTYRDLLNERFQNQGINIETASGRLETFYQVTNTYLSVFGIFGALGMITGIAGLGFVLLRSYNQRKREFALMLATGFSVSGIKMLIFKEQTALLAAGVITGVISATVATLPSLIDNPEIPWLFLAGMVVAIIVTGITVLMLSLGNITESSLSQCLRKE